MKELSIEEKAKAYDEAIERASELNYVSDKDSLQRKTVEHIFPELKESDNNRVRNRLIEFFKGYSPDEEWWGNITQEDILAWLEKQGENISLPKFTFDDVLALQCAMEAAKKVQKDKDLYEQLKSLHDRLHDAYWLEKQGEQKYAWSEEDEKVIHCLEYTIKHFYEDEDTIKWCCDWFKCLKERYTWKPSEEQMDALHYVTNFDYGGHKATLVSLYEQLKKLREEDV